MKQQRAKTFAYTVAIGGLLFFLLSLFWDLVSKGGAIASFGDFLILFEQSKYVQIGNHGNNFLMLAAFGFTAALVAFPYRRWFCPIAIIGSLFFTFRYLLWRFTTLFPNPNLISDLVTWLFFAAELILIIRLLVTLIQSLFLDLNRRKRQANQYEPDIQPGRFYPSVDVFIATYNESTQLLSRTIVAAKKLDYTNKKIYVLDDGNRPKIADLAAKLKVNYINRPNNQHRKAGNLNHALSQTTGEFILVLDADFIVFPRFLKRVLGFFQSEQVALVQTPQHYYNPDNHNKNLDLGSVLPHDVDYFYSYLQPLRDRFNAVMCCGTSYVVRRKALEAVGGYVTECVVEDYQTSTKMLTQGYEVVFLNEILSIGEVPRNSEEYIQQRLRWLQGNFQLYFHPKELPIWTRLSFTQLLFYILELGYCLTPFSRIIILLSPLVALAFQVTIMQAELSEYLYFAIPFLLSANFSLIYLSRNRYFPFWVESYEILLAMSASIRILRTLFKPQASFASGVTGKEITTHSNLRFNLRITWFLWSYLGVSIAIYLITLFSLDFFLVSTYAALSVSITLLWTIYNLIMVILAILSGIDTPEKRQTDRHQVNRVVSFQLADKTFWGVTSDLSEAGCKIKLTTPFYELLPLRQTGKLYFPEANITLNAELMSAVDSQMHGYLGLQFLELTLAQTEALLSMIFVHNPRIAIKASTNALDAVILMFSSVLNPKRHLSS